MKNYVLSNKSKKETNAVEDISDIELAEMRIKMAELKYKMAELRYKLEKWKKGEEIEK